MDIKKSTQLPSEGFVRIRAVLQMFPYSRTSLWRKVRDGTFPKPHKLGPKTVAWDIEELREWKRRITGGNENG